MKLTDIFIRANKNLARSKVRTILTITAIVIGSFTMSLTVALGEGLNKIVDQQVSNLSAGNAIIVSAKTTDGDSNPIAATPAKYNAQRDASTGAVFLNEEDIKKIQNVSGVVSILKFPPINVEYIQRDKDFEKFRLSLESAGGITYKTIVGKFPTDTEDGYIVLPEKYVAALGFNSREDIINKRVTVVYKNLAGTDFVRTYRVVALISNSLVNNGSGYISSQEIARVDEFQTKGTSLYKKYGAVGAFGKTDISQGDLNKLRDSIRELGYSADTLDDQTTSVRGIVNVVQIVIGIFGAMIVIASVFGIVNTLFMSVFERTREIGLMKAVGMSGSTVFAIFAIEAGSIGFWGGIVGVLLGWGAGSILNYYLMKGNFFGFEGMTFLVFSLPQMLLIICALSVVGLISGVLPAMKASRLDPIEALRHE